MAGDRHLGFGRVFALLPVFILFFLFAGLTFVHAASVGKITILEGTVTVLKANRNVAAPVKMGDPVDVGDVYRSRTNGLMEITFNNRNIIRIGHNTHIQITEYVVNERRSSSVTKLYEGKIRITSGQDFIKRAAALGESKLEVHTPVVVAGIRGSTAHVAHVEGVSGTMLSVGQGYMYNPRFPDRRESIVAGMASFASSTTPPTAPVPAQQAVRQAVGIPGVSADNVVRAAIKLEAPPNDVVRGAIEGGAAVNTVVAAAVGEAPAAAAAIVSTAVQAAPDQAGSIAVAAVNAAASPAQVSTILAAVVQTQATPQDVAAVVVEAIRSNPEQAANIIAGAVAAAPNASQAITDAAQGAGVPATTIRQGVSDAANVVVPAPAPVTSPYAPPQAPPTSTTPPPPTPPTPGGGGGGGGGASPS